MKRTVTCALLLCCAVPMAMGDLAIPDLSKKKKKKKKDKEEVVVPPQAIPATAEVNPGGTVQIPLRVYGWRGRNVRYLLRSQPTAGQVQLTPGREGVWVLTYQHNGDLPGEEGAWDQLFYAAQDDTGTSAAAEVRIKVVDYAPKFEMPAATEFGDVYVGETLTRKFTMANRGGGVLYGSFIVEEPWTVEPQQFKLPRGMEQEVTLTFKAEAEQEFRGKLTMAGEEGATMVLSAMARDAFRVEPSELDLVGSADSLERSGSYTVTNRTEEPQFITLKGDPRLKLPSEIAVPPGESVALNIRLGEDDLLGLREAVVFSNGAAERSARVIAQAVPARLVAVVAKGEGLELGTIAGRQEETVVVANRGGTIAATVVTAPPGVEVSPLRFDLEPGDTVELKVAVTPGQSGDLDEVIRLQAAGTILEVPVRATIATEEATASTASVAATSAGATSGTPQKSVAPVKGRAASKDAPERLVDRMLAPVRKIAVRPLGGDRVELSWKKVHAVLKADGPVGYLLEVRHLFQQADGKMGEEWLPATGVTLQQTGEQVSAVFSGVPRGRSAAIRVVTQSADGQRFSAPSAVYQVSLPPRRPFFTWQRIALGFFAAIAAGALWLRFRRSGESFELVKSTN